MIMIPCTLFYYRSLRIISIASIVVFLAIGFVYFGQVAVIQSFGFDPFVSLMLLGLSEILSHVILLCIITKTPRKKSSFILFFIIILLLVVSGMVSPNDQCKNCPKGIAEISLSFVVRFLMSFAFSLFLIYLPEVYPMRIRGIGYGIISGIGFNSATIAQILFPYLEKKSISPMYFQAFMCIIGFCCFFFFE